MPAAKPSIAKLKPFAAHLRRGLEPRKAGDLVGISRQTADRWLKQIQTEHPVLLKKDAGPVADDTLTAEEQEHSYFRRAEPLATTDKRIGVPSRPFPHHANCLVITSAVNATPADLRFLAALEGFCMANRGTLLVKPIRYKNPTSVFTADQERDDWWDASLRPFICTERAEWHGWTYVGDSSTQPTASSPLSGYEVVTGGSSAVIGHPQVALSTVPTLPGKPAKVVASTGAVTVPNYTASKAGLRGEFHHSLAALILMVDEDDDVFFWHVYADQDGGFQHLDRYYKPDGTRRPAAVKALVTGDEHVEFIDPGVVSATYDAKDSIVSTLRPDYIVRHDVNDNYAGSHHHVHSPLTQLAKAKAGKDDMAAELKRTFEFIERTTPNFAKSVIVSSNHSHDHLKRWFEETDPRKDPVNFKFWCELGTYAAETTRMYEGGATHGGLFEFVGRKFLQNPDCVHFLGRNESLNVLGWELSMHGDVGPNGSRGSRKALDKVGTKSIVGHSHSPGITGGVLQVGLSAVYNMEYARGPSSWMHCHAIVYETGRATLLPIVNGKWRPRARG